MYIYQSSKRSDLDWGFDVHPIVAVMSAGVAVVAVGAFTLRSALYSRSEALTVILAAGRFLACAPSGRHKRWHAFEVARVAVVGHLLRVEDAGFVAWVVLAARADAV